MIRLPFETRNVGEVNQRLDSILDIIVVTYVECQVLTMTKKMMTKFMGKSEPHLLCAMCMSIKKLNSVFIKTEFSEHAREHIRQILGGKSLNPEAAALALPNRADQDQWALAPHHQAQLH